MAIEAERLLAIFEAKFTSLEKALAKARTDANKSFGDIQAAGTRAENALSKVGSKGTPGINKMAGAVRGARLETGNLAAQLNDIGTQLAGGQSPFLIAIQQGTQINQILGQAGARGAVSLLGGAFASLINPVSLATIGIITLGGAAVQYFTSVVTEGDKSEETLKREAELIQQVANRWGEALPALQAYANEKQRLADKKAADDATAAAIADAWRKAQIEIDGASVSIADLIALLRDYGAEPREIVALQNAFGNLHEKVDDGTAKVEDLNRVSSALSTLFSDTQIPIVSELAARFEALAGSIAEARAQSVGLASDQSKLDISAQVEKNLRDGVRDPKTGEVEKSVLPQLDPLGFVNPMRDQNNRAEATQSQTEIERERNALRSAGGRSGASEAERERQAVADLVDQLQFEYDLIGRSDVEREKAYALRRAGAAATDEQKTKIASLVESIDAEREALRQNEQAMRDLQDMGRDFLGSFIHDLTEGKSAADALADALGRVADRLLDSALDNLFSGGFGGGTGKGGLLGGVLIPGILHSGGVAGKDGYGHGRAASPSVFAGARRYHTGGIAGLKAGEVPAILQRGEVVLPKNMARGSATMPTITYAPVYNVTGGGPEIDQLRQQMAKDQAQFPAKVIRAIHGARRHSVKV